MINFTTAYSRGTTLAAASWAAQEHDGPIQIASEYCEALAAKNTGPEKWSSEVACRPQLPCQHLSPTYSQAGHLHSTDNAAISWRNFMPREWRRRMQCPMLDQAWGRLHACTSGQQGAPATARAKRLLWRSKELSSSPRSLPSLPSRSRSSVRGSWIFGPMATQMPLVVCLRPLMASISWNAVPNCMPP